MNFRVWIKRIKNASKFSDFAGQIFLWKRKLPIHLKHEKGLILSRNIYKTISVYHIGHNSGYILVFLHL